MTSMHSRRTRHPNPFRLSCLAIPLLVLAVAATSAVAQMPGMPEEKPRPSAAATAVVEAAANQASAVEAVSVREYGRWGRFYSRYMGLESPYRPVILTILTLLILVSVKRQLSKVMRQHVDAKAYDSENAKAFMKVWNLVWKFVIAILVLLAMSGSLKLLGLTAGFLGMMLGWSLQQPVTGIAAWLMIIFKKPFQIGDRVVIAGITGDVTAISLTHVILNQVGGSIGGEERSGRGILIPNAILFQNVIINYTLDQKYMLDEVPVRMTFDSDWERAKEIMLAAATEVTREIIAETDTAPFIRAEFLDWGVLARLRYNTIPAKRQELSTYIVEILMRDFGKEYPRVKFAVPASNIRYKLDEPGGKEQVNVPPLAGPGVEV